ncbi:MAG: hypothetical protein PHP17_06160 [Candidatus Omnitrophica bacterium]|nr:hypothetical protein [Candidatus Omnitrophota bacterium]
MKDSILPEEKLLRLIRMNKKSNNAAVFASPKNLKNSAGRFSFNFSGIGLNKTIKFIFFVSFLYLTISIIHPVLAPKKIKLPQVETKTKLPARKEMQADKTQIKPYDFYSTGIKGRNIFQGISADLEKPIGAASADLIKDINLVGIVSGDEPQAVIEDKKAQKTYYLRKGQFMGEMQLAEILEGKIILNYEGQMYELYL